MLIPTYSYNDTFDITVFQIFDFVFHLMKDACIKLFIPILLQQLVFQTFFEHLVIKFVLLRTGRLHHQVSARTHDQVADRVQDQVSDRAHDQVPARAHDKVSEQPHIWFPIGFNTVLINPIFKIYESNRGIHSEVFRKSYHTFAIYYDIHFLINFTNIHSCFDGHFMDFDICLEIAFLSCFPFLKVSSKRRLYFVIGRIPVHVEALRRCLPDRRSNNFDALFKTVEIHLMSESFENFLCDTLASNSFEVHLRQQVH